MLSRHRSGTLNLIHSWALAGFGIRSWNMAGRVGSLDPRRSPSGGRLAPHDEPFASRAGKPHPGRKIGTNRGEDEGPSERSPVSAVQEEVSGEEDLDEHVRRGDGVDPPRERMLFSEAAYTLDIRVRGALVHTRAQRDHRRHVRKDDAAGPNGQQGVLREPPRITYVIKIVISTLAVAPA